jgi:hypothetical protein
MKKREEMGLISIVLVIVLIGLVSANNIDIEIGNIYAPGDVVEFRIVLYDDSTNVIDGKVDYVIQDYYTNIIDQGSVNSGEEVNFRLNEDSFPGLWKITANYQDIEKEGWFNVEELEKAEINLEGSTLIISNIGNIPYSKRVDIYIGDNVQTALISLDVGVTKRVKLTAPDGDYDIRVVEQGSGEEAFKVSGVSLTGNVVGLEGDEGKGFFGKYPLISLFFSVLILVAVVILGLKAHKKYLK